MTITMNNDDDDDNDSNILMTKMISLMMTTMATMDSRASEYNAIRGDPGRE